MAQPNRQLNQRRWLYAAKVDPQMRMPSIFCEFQGTLLTMLQLIGRRPQTQYSGHGKFQRAAALTWIGLVLFLVQMNLRAPKLTRQVDALENNIDYWWFLAISRVTSRFRDRVHKGDLDTTVLFRLYCHLRWKADGFIGLFFEGSVNCFAEIASPNRACTKLFHSFMVDKIIVLMRIDWAA